MKYKIIFWIIATLLLSVTMYSALAETISQTVSNNYINQNIRKGYDFLAGTPQVQAQTFTLPEDGEINYIELTMGRGGTAADYCRAYIYNSSTTSELPDSQVGNYAEISGSLLGTSPKKVNFTYNTSLPSLNGGELYWLLLGCGSATMNARAYGSTTDTVSSASAYYKGEGQTVYTSANFTAYNVYDLYYIIDYTPAAVNATANNFTTIDVADFEQEATITVGNAWATVNSVIITNEDNNTPYYATASFTTNSTVASNSECRIVMDGNTVIQSSRSLSASSTGNFGLVSNPLNISEGNFTVSLQCRKTGGGNYDITNSNLQIIHLYDSNVNNSLQYQAYNISGLSVNTTPQLLYTFNIDTSNTSNTTNLPNIVVDGRASYTYGLTGSITTYLINDNNGEVCGNYTRYGSSGSTGSVATVCLFDDLEPNTQYNLSLYGFTSTGTGTINNAYINIYEALLNNTATNNTRISANVSNNTVTNIGNITISNILGGSYETLVVASVNVVGNSTEEAYFYLSDGVTNSLKYYRTLNNLGQGNLRLNKAFTETGTGTNTYSVYAYCPDGCTVEYAELTGIVADADTASTGEFIITAQNSYNSTSIQVFNATVDGATYTTTNGSILALGSGSQSVTIRAENFFTNTTTHDTTTSLTANLKPYTEIRAYQYLGGGTVNNFILNSSVGNYTTTNGVAYLPITTNTSVTIIGDSIATQTDNITAVQYYNFTVYAYNSILFYIYDGLTTNYLTQSVTVTSVYDNQVFSNTTSNGTLYLTLLTPAVYQVRINSTNYTTQSVFLTVDNASTQQVYVYMLENATNTDIVRVKVLNLQGSEVEGARVKLQKQQTIGEGQLYYTVDEKSTNTDGDTAFYATKSLTDYYRFIVIYNDITVLTTEETFFIPNVDEVITLTIDTLNTTGVYIDRYSVTTSLTRSGISNETITYTFSDGENSISGGTLEVWVQYINATDFAPELYSTNTTTGFTGSISVVLPVVNNTEFFIYGYIDVNDQSYLYEVTSVIFGETLSTDRNTGLLLASIVFIIVVLLTLTLGGLASGLLGLITLLGLTLIGLVNIPVAVITSLIAFLFIITVKTKGGGQ